MKILACLKIVPDLDMIAQEDWVADAQLQVDVNYGKLMWNCFEEGALEMMLKLSDLSESFDVVYELRALTIGEKKSESFLKTLYALGFAETIRIQTEADLRFCPSVVADMIVDYVKNQQMQDLLVFGTQSTDGSNQKTPMLVAEALGCPCITQVIDMQPVDETHIQIVHQEDGKQITQVIALPCVVAVGNAVCSYLRIPTLKDKMRLGKKPIICIEKQLPQDFIGDAELVSLQCIQQDRESVLLSGESVEEIGEKLFQQYLKERLSPR